MTVSLTINGQRREVREGQTLLNALREELRLKGTRFGCGEENCGACTVIVDGQARPSCTLAVTELENRNVETVESLGSPEAPKHPLARAIISEQAAQCGYCLPGILMSAKALLDSDPDPDEAMLHKTLDGNLCRCGAHLRILRAIRKAAAELRAGT